jgi:hypothetical protein
MRPLLLLAFCLSACGEQEAPAPRNKERESAAPSAAAPATGPAEAEARRDGEAGQDAAAVLKRYYVLIEGGDLEGAWRMRSGAEEGRERFLSNFKAYESYRATVGTPSRTAEAGGWQYVEVPVMIYGRFRGGKGFGNSGSVTLRRAHGAKDATERERSWHIYTG